MKTFFLNLSKIFLREMLYLNNNYRLHLLNLIQESAEKALKEERTKYDHVNYEYNLQDATQLKTQEEVNLELEEFYMVPLSERCVIL